MQMRAKRSRGLSGDYWPGFVDALATLLLVLIFLISIFVLAQFYLGQALSGRDAALAQLNAKITELGELLDLAEKKNEDLESNILQLTSTLTETQDLVAERDESISAISALLVAAQSAQQDAEGKLEGLRSNHDEERQISAEAQAQITLLNEQMAALRLQLASLQDALEAAEARDAESKAVIENLGQRLNAALAQKVQELAGYRSEFFGRLKEALGNRSDIEIVGDRFILQSGVLFESGSADISPEGQIELLKIARILREISVTIPSDINWVLRVDGHSDKNPISTTRYPSNWHLSAARAISVVTYLIDQDVPADRLVAAGFGQYQPLISGDNSFAYERNRRIEFKLTQR